MLRTDAPILERERERERALPEEKAYDNRNCLNRNLKYAGNLNNDSAPTWLGGILSLEMNPDRN